MIAPAIALALFAHADSGWEEAAKTKGVTVYSRSRAGTAVQECKAIGLIDAPPELVWKAIRDFPNYPKNMPYTEQTTVLATEQEGKVSFVYSVIDAPLVSRRDYVIRVTDESTWDGKQGYLKSAWTGVNEGQHARGETKGLVRVKINDGYWQLEPRDNGTRTYATYYVFTDPGGVLPKFVVNRANSTAVPAVFEAVRKTVEKSKK